MRGLIALLVCGAAASSIVSGAMLATAGKLAFFGREAPDATDDYSPVRLLIWLRNQKLRVVLWGNVFQTLFWEFGFCIHSILPLHAKREWKRFAWLDF